MTPEHREQFEAGLNTHYEKQAYVIKALAKYDQAIIAGKIPVLRKTMFGNKHTNRIFIIEYCPIKGKYFSADGWQGTSVEKICGCGCNPYTHNPKNLIAI